MMIKLRIEGGVERRYKKIKYQKSKQKRMAKIRLRRKREVGHGEEGEEMKEEGNLSILR
jgi:hypothetical protein